MNRYLKRYAAKLPRPLPKEEQAALARRRDEARSRGDETEARACVERIVLHAQRLSLHIVMDRYGHLPQREDCMRVALIGVWYAAQTWSPEKGAFTTWVGKATRWVLNRELFEGEMGPLRIPGGSLTARRQLKRYCGLVYQETGVYPTYAEIAEHFELFESRVRKVMSDIEFVPLKDELQVVTENHQSTARTRRRQTTPGIDLPDTSKDPEEASMDSRFMRIYSEAYDLVLTDTQRIVLDLAQRNFTLKEIGEHIGRSRERTRQIIREAYRRIREQSPIIDWEPERRAFVWKVIEGPENF
jgi:DNA-directed RNA polymerase specialized sigma subunit